MLLTPASQAPRKLPSPRRHVYCDVRPSGSCTRRRRASAGCRSMPGAFFQLLSAGRRGQVAESQEACAAWARGQRQLQRGDAAFRHKPGPAPLPARQTGRARCITVTQRQRLRMQQSSFGTGGKHRCAHQARPRAQRGRTDPQLRPVGLLGTAPPWWRGQSPGAARRAGRPGGKSVRPLMGMQAAPVG